MIDLTQDQHDQLSRISRAGAQGVELDVSACPVGAATYFALHGLATLTRSRPQRAIITQQGRAFLQRVAWA